MVLRPYRDGARPESGNHLRTPCRSLNGRLHPAHFPIYRLASGPTRGLQKIFKVFKYKPRLDHKNLDGRVKGNLWVQPAKTNSQNRWGITANDLNFKQ